MDLEKQRNHKFNFFKSAPSRQSLGFSNLKDANDYTTLFVVGLWIISGMFFRMDMRHQPVQQSAPISVASVAMNPVDDQEKLKFITQVKSLKSAKDYKQNTPQLLQEINKELNLIVTKFEDDEGVLEVQGHLADNKKVELVFEDDSISVKWVNVTPNEVKLFTNAWKGQAETEIRTNADNTQEIILVANVLRMNASPIAITPSSKIKSLESQVEKLQQENIELRKSNAQLVVKKAIKENPQLKDQEKQIQKFVDSFVKAAK